MSHGKEKKSRSKAVGSDTPDTVDIWCLEGMKTSDIEELNIVLPEFEKTHLEHKERTDSKVYRAAIDTFYVNVKEQVIKLLKESQMLKNLKRKNAKYDSSSLPALLFKARTLLGAESHLRNINHQLEKLLDQE